MYYFDGLNTPVGRLHVVVSDDALLHIYFPSEKWNEHFERAPQHPLIKKTKIQLAEYFAGERRIFDIPIAPEGTDFQRKAWSVLRKIPYGKTISYADEARRLKKPDAVRASGTANGKNPIPIIIPCHRVIPKTGGVGSYSGGTHRKKLLLKLEKHHLGTINK